jgi:hypothetical protein
VKSSNVVRFSQMLAEDFLCTTPDATLLDRVQFLEQTAKPYTIRDLQAHDVIVRLMGDVAIVHARTTFVYVDGRTGAGRYTDIYARRGGRWLAVAAQFARS